MDYLPCIITFCTWPLPYLFKFPYSPSRKTSITGILISTNVTNLNILDGSGSANATDVRDFQSGTVSIVSSATTGGLPFPSSF